MSKPTILVAEHNDSNFLLVNAILKKYANIVRAVNGLEAVNAVKKAKNDLVLMDIRMPIMDGLEATTEIRKLDPDIPIVALTANAFDSDRERALAAGCNDFIAKPIRKSDLLDLVQKWTGAEF